jgi:MGT family glycosyltransferase
LWPDDAAEPPRLQRLRPEGTAEPATPPPADLAHLPHATTVHITLGTVANRATELFHRILTALRDEPLNIVVTVGPDQDPSAFGPQPENVVLASYIPIDLVLPRCQAVVAHGGSGTLLAALRHGLPQLLLPFDGDNVRNARLCEAAGAAIQVSPRELDGELLREAVRRLVGDPMLVSAALRIKDEMESMPTPAQVVPVLEGLAAGGATPGT